MSWLANRRRKSGSPALPYDAEVEYLLRYDKNAYINTGIIPTSDMGLKIVFEISRIFTTPLCGTFANSGGNLCVRAALYNFFIVYNGSTYIDTGVNKSTALNTKTTIIIDTNHNIIVNGETVGQFARNSQMNEIPIYLFTSNTGSFGTIFKSVIVSVLPLLFTLLDTDFSIVS